MIYLILGILLIICILVLWGLWLLLIRKPYIFVTLIISIFTLYEYSVYKFHLSFLPDGMHIWKQLYVSEKAWGVGMPGDNETGIIEFELPSRASEKIEKDGINYLKTLKNSNKCSAEWLETPITSGDSWFKNTDGKKSATADVENYLYRYGFYIPIDKKIIVEVNESISKPGSYLSYCSGGGVIIVMPKIQKIIFAYSG